MSTAPMAGEKNVGGDFGRLVFGALRHLVPSAKLRGVMKRVSASAAHQRAIVATSQALASSPRTLRALNNVVPEESAERFYLKLFNAAARDSNDSRKVARFIKLLDSEPGLKALGRALAAGKRSDLELLDFARLVSTASYAEDLFATRAAATWLDDPRFVSSYAAGASVSVWGHNIRWRVQTLLKCAVQASRVEGDFVECGVDCGGTALSVLTYLTPDAFAGREFHLFDTFEGVQPMQMTTEEISASKLKQGRYIDAYEQVGRTFDPFPFVKLVRGMVPDTLSQYTGSKVAYLHIDMNVSLPECEALRYFWPRLSRGAPVIFDDYGFPFHQQQRKDLDRVAASLGVEIMMLPTGQGLMWK